MVEKPGRHHPRQGAPADMGLGHDGTKSKPSPGRVLAQMSPATRKHQPNPNSTNQLA